MRRKLLGWALVVTALVLAALYATCGRGFGLGFGGKGKGKGSGSGPGPGSVQPLLSPADAGPRRCQVRVAASGITVDGKPATVEEAVAACKGAIEAEVLVTGGARQADREDLETALDRAGIPIVSPRSKGGGGSGESPAGGSDRSGSGT